jgi:hypothetical protein
MNIMDKIYNYCTPIRGTQKTRYRLENFLSPLTDFFDEFTNIKLYKLICSYCPRRLSDPEAYNIWLKLQSGGFYKDFYKSLETDEEIDNTIKKIESLNIINKVYDDLMSPNIEEHRYEIDIKCYNDILELVKSKYNSESYILLEIKERFDLLNYDYSEIKKELPWIHSNDYNPNKLANRMDIHISCTFERKYYQDIHFDLYCPKSFEEEKNYFIKIKNKLKINYIARYFGVYQKNKKGEWKRKKEKIEM